MKANEFVKKFGVEHAKLHIENMEAVQIGNNHQEYINSLKQIVDAFELVESYGGLEVAKTCEYSEDLDHVKYNVNLSRAINLVEQCQ